MAFAALANIAALAMLIPVAFRLMRDYDAQRRTREYPVFDPKMFPDLNLDHEAWADAADAVPESRRRSA
jgi:AGCS family alanine or glycine:cation symporter